MTTQAPRYGSSVRGTAASEPELDAFAAHMRAIRKVPLLTPEREVELAKRIERGDTQAKEELVRANLRLVVWIAKRSRGRGLSLVDLVQQGSLGLIRAAERFDHRLGHRFATYAVWSIRHVVNLRFGLGGPQRAGACTTPSELLEREPACRHRVRTPR